jgi:hypothetical protein
MSNFDYKYAQMLKKCDQLKKKRRTSFNLARRFSIILLDVYSSTGASVGLLTFLDVISKINETLQVFANGLPVVVGIK